MADNKVINAETVANPEMLVEVLFALSSEIRRYQSTINELIIDHSGFVAAHDSLAQGMSTLGAAFLSGCDNISAAVVIENISGEVQSAFSSGVTAGPAQLTSSAPISVFTDVSAYGNR